MRFLGEDPVAPSLEQPLSLNPFVYGLNNPVMYVDYDGRENKEAAKFALENMANYKYGNTYGGKAIPVSYVKDNKITKLVCNQFVSLAYRGANETDFPWYSYSDTRGNWINFMQSWFKDNGKYLTGENMKTENLEIGDAIFTGKNGKIGHVAIISDIKSNGSFSVQGAHNKGTGVLQERGNNKYYKSISIFEKWFRQDLIGIGQQEKK